VAGDFPMMGEEFIDRFPPQHDSDLRGRTRSFNLDHFMASLHKTVPSRAAPLERTEE
jgi:hypothetical protein